MQRAIGIVIAPQQRFHQLGRARCSADRAETRRLRIRRRSVRGNRAVIFHPQKQILRRRRADLGENHPRQKRRAINLFERAFSEAG